MKITIYEKLAGSSLAMTLLFLISYPSNYDLANLFRNLGLISLATWFVLSWMKSKSMLGFFSSMLLVCWFILLYNPLTLTQHLRLVKEEASLTQLAMLIAESQAFQKVSIYQNKELGFVNEKAKNSALYQRMEFDTGIKTLDYDDIQKDTLLIQKIKQLLETTAIQGFQLGHDSILFHLNETEGIRYYYNKNTPPFWGDKKIKSHWYWVTFKV